MIRGIEHKGEPLHYLFDGLTERLVQKFGTSLLRQKRLHFCVGITRVPKVRANSSTGTLLPILDVTVTIVSDTEIETIDLIFRIELGKEYLSVVSMQFGHENGQVFVTPVDHDSFFQPIDLVTIVSDT